MQMTRGEVQFSPYSTLLVWNELSNECAFLFDENKIVTRKTVVVTISQSALYNAANKFERLPMSVLLSDRLAWHT
ncbi:hypothetical protein D918_05730 [Trichuris suis]|nr:hypothetical protein D918_05730 [Trichuris suis]